MEIKILFYIMNYTLTFIIIIIIFLYWLVNYTKQGKPKYVAIVVYTHNLSSCNKMKDACASMKDEPYTDCKGP